jgi:hypothetical protein
MKTSRVLVAIFFASAVCATLVLFRSVTNAQTEFETTIYQFSGDAVKGYLQPAADLFGANMFAGQFRSAEIPTTGFSVAFDIVGMVALVSDDQKSYTAKTPTNFTPSTFNTATIFGGTGTTVVNSSIPALSYRGMDGIINANAVPLAVPQLRIGSLYGTEVFVRYVRIPQSLTDKFPDVTLFGAGVRHSISQYFPEIPLDVAVGGFYTTFNTGDLVDFKGYSFGIQGSKSFSVLTVYGGFAYESCTMKLQYTSTDPNVPGRLVDVSLDGQNTFRATAGAALSLAIFNIFADVNLGSVTNFSGGIGVGF